MGITKQSGIATARQKAALDTELFRTAEYRFGEYLKQYLGNFPYALAAGHVLLVNRNLEFSPKPYKGRWGYLAVTSAAANAAQLSLDKLSDPTACTYAWGCDINATALSLYTKNTKLFVTPNADYWRTVYLKYVVGDAVFSALWANRVTSDSSIYNGIISPVETLSSNVPGWRIADLQYKIFVDCEYVYQLSKSRSLLTEGFGIKPVLGRDLTTAWLTNG